MGRKVLGIDAGTNSVGHALIDTDEKKIIECNVSRIENSSIEPKDRTQIRTTRRMNERFKLRRERIIRVLHVLGFLPEHYEKLINFTNHPGQLISGCDDEKFPLISMDGNRLLFKDYYNDMINDIISKNKHFDCSYSKTLYNHTLYYIRKIALSQKISKYALSWILLKANHKRGYNQNIGIHDFSEDEQKKGKRECAEQVPCSC
jgi:CRISPR-associated endonuclease Csn1